MPSFRSSLALLVGLCTCAVVVPGSADDWPQYRRDARRSGASDDPVSLPLTDLWSVKGGTPPLVWQGRVFLVQPFQKSNVLLCLDARTGALLWSRPIGGSPFTGLLDQLPTITEQGIVVTRSGAVAECVNVGTRAFDARTGRPLSAFNGRTPVRRQELVLSGERGGAPAGVRQVETTQLGPILAVGEELFGLGYNEDLVRWVPGTLPVASGLFHALGPEARIAARFERNIPSLGPGGLLVSGWWNVDPTGFNGHTEFLAQMDAGGQVAWHRRFPAAVGTPFSSLRNIFVPIGGGNLLALDPGGQTRWQYPEEFRRSPPTLRHFVVRPNRDLFRGQYVVTRSKVYVNDLTALDERSGRIVWRQPVQGGYSIAASREHLFVAASGQLQAYHLDDGKLAWSTTTPLGRDQELALSGGLLFAGTQKQLIAYAPAERTFHLAIDSERTDVYGDNPAAGPPPAKELEASGGGGEPPAPAAVRLADASTLRLRFDEPSAELRRKVLERKGKVGPVPLTLSVDWLDATRTNIVGKSSGPGWNAPSAANYARLCAGLAKEARPAYFDIAPEVNVYLTRDPAQLEPVLAMLRSVRAAIREQSPETRVLVSLNVEVLLGAYGKGPEAPFGTLPLPDPKEKRRLEHVGRLVRELDAMGLVSRPRSAFSNPALIPHDFLLRALPVLEGRPLVVTFQDLGPRASLPVTDEMEAQLLHRMLRCCYWLNAKVVAYAAAGSLASDTGGVNRKTTAPPRAALAAWQAVKEWKRVERLSALPASPVGQAENR